MSLGAAGSEALNWGAKGASIGSFIPGVGTLIGGGIGAAGGFLHGLFSGGDDDKPKEEKFDVDKTALTTVKGLQAQSAKNQQRGDELGGMSSEALAPVLNYFKQLASGDPQAVMAATQPERGRVIDQYDSARKAASIAAPRGGGTTSAIVQSYVTEANQLSDLTSQAHRDANTTLGNMGVNLAGLGLSADQLASADLDSIIQAVFAQKSVDAQKRGQNMGMLGDVGEAVGTIVAILASGGGAQTASSSGGSNSYYSSIE